MIIQWITRKAKAGIGIEINSAFIKLVELKASGSDYSISNLAIAPLPPEVVIDNQIKDPEALAAAISNLYPRLVTKKPKIVTSVPGPSVAIKNIKVESRLTEEELEAHIWMEAGKHFPDLVEDISLDFDVLERSSDPQKQSEVLLVACRREHVLSRLTAIDTAGFKTNVVDVEYYALERALNKIAKQLPDFSGNKTIALLNLSALITLIVIQNGKLIYYHDHIVNEQTLLTSLQKYLTINANTLDYADGLELVKQDLLPQVGWLLQLFYSEQPMTHIDHLMLAGECAVINSIADLFQQQLKMPVAIANPFQNMQLPTTANKTSIDLLAPAFTVCTGLALRGLGYGAH